MSSLPPLDTVTGAYNNLLDAIKNDDSTLPGQLRGALNLVSAGLGAQTIFGQLGAYVMSGGTVGELATRIAPALELFGRVGLATDVAAALIGIGIAYNKQSENPTAANQQEFANAVGKFVLQGLVAAGLLYLGAGFGVAAVAFGLMGLAIDLVDAKNLEGLLNFLRKVPSLGGQRHGASRCLWRNRHRDCLGEHNLLKRWPLSSQAHSCWTGLGSRGYRSPILHLLRFARRRPPWGTNYLFCCIFESPGTFRLSDHNAFPFDVC
jgi:hypothetical protein